MNDAPPCRGPGSLKWSCFYLPRLRYVDPAPYTQVEFERAYGWMRTWDLVGANANYESLVCNRVQ